jgi:membrane-associated phospholipid phosphatase
MSFWGALLALSFHVAPATAQLRADSLRKDLGRLAGDVWSVWTSPAHANAADLYGLGAAAAVSGISAALDEPFHNWIVAHPKAWPVRVFLDPLREGARYPAYELGSGQYLLPISAVLYIAGSAGHSKDLRDAGLGCATAHLTSAGAREIVYLLIARQRPRMSPDDPFRFHVPGVHDWNAHSFFSGHIANSMGCASFLSHRFALRAGEPVLYTLVTAIGLGRVFDGRHWLSDTMVGGLFGYATGRAIAARMLKRERTATLAATGQPLMVSFSVPFD